MAQNRLLEFAGGVCRWWYFGVRFRRKLNHLNMDGLQKLNGFQRSVLDLIEDLANAPQIDEPLCARRTGEMSHKDVFFCGPWGVAIDHGVLLGVKTAAVSGFVAIAGVG